MHSPTSPTAGSCCAAAPPDRPAISPSIGVRRLLSRPDAGQVLVPAGAGAVDGRARDLERHALHRGRGQDLRGPRVAGGRLRRLLVVELRPDPLEDVLGEEPGQDPEEDPERLVDELHRTGTYPARALPYAGPVSLADGHRAGSSLRRCRRAAA